VTKWTHSRCRRGGVRTLERTGCLAEDGGHKCSLGQPAVWYVCTPRACAHDCDLRACLRERERRIASGDACGDVPFLHPVPAEQVTEKDTENVQDPFVRDCAEGGAGREQLDSTSPSLTPDEGPDPTPKKGELDSPLSARVNCR
jgi:hypothetical protein